MSPDTYERIFVLTYEGIGDLVFVMPLLYALNDHWPGARIQLAASALQRAFASSFIGGIVKVVPHHATDYREWPALLGAVRAFKPDLFLDLDGGLRYGVLSLLSSARRRIHPPPELTKAHAARLHRETVPFNPSGHRVETWLAVLDRLQIPRRRISFEFDTPGPAREQAARLAQTIPPGSIALVPTSGNPRKDWPAESLQRTVNVLSRDMGRPVVIFGKAKRQPEVAHAIDLGGTSSLMADAHLLRYSGLFDVVAGVDTGTMQIAGSISSDADGRYGDCRGVRTVSLFGPTLPEVYRPYDPTRRFNLALAPATPSQAMGFWGWAGDRLTRDYMAEIAPDDIVDAVQTQLKAVRSSESGK